jgi:hypothetical protein
MVMRDFRASCRLFWPLLAIHPQSGKTNTATETSIETDAAINKYKIRLNSSHLVAC